MEYDDDEVVVAVDVAAICLCVELMLCTLVEVTEKAVVVKCCYYFLG